MIIIPKKFSNSWKFDDRSVIFQLIWMFLVCSIREFHFEFKKMDKNNKNFKNGQISPKNGQNSKMNEKSKKLLKIQKNSDFWFLLM